MNKYLTVDGTDDKIASTTITDKEGPPRYVHFRCLEEQDEPQYDLWAHFAMSVDHARLISGTCEICGRTFTVAGRKPEESIHFI